MNNEEKILFVLENLTAKVDKLEAGQAKLEAGQAKLEAGQAKLEAKVDRLEQKNNQRFDTLEQSVKDIDTKLETYSREILKDVGKLETRLEKLEPAEIGY
ncbi:MAG: hypothetical protein LBS36_13650 [Oscillospiraceae bacterium]|jgi:chromosome segregation ATPase|nr:hypothetical protein [Oscillospiraceae bacterium]